MKKLLLFIITPFLISAQQSKWYDEFQLNGFLSSSYSYNLNKPASGKNGYRVFDFDDNSFKIDVAELVFQKPASKAGEGGFRIDMTTGSSIPPVVNPNKEAGDIDFHQLYLSYIADIGNGVRIDAGKFVTHLGYEVIEGYDGYNDNASRSFLFGYAIPYTNTGVRITYPFTKQLSMMVMAVNGWDNSIDNNKSKTVGAMVTYTPTDRITFNGCFSGGPELDSNNSINRLVYEFTTVIKLNDQLTIGADALCGQEIKYFIDGKDAIWYGAAGYIRYYLTENFSLAIRGEMFDDWSGTRTGIPQRLDEITFTPEYKLNKNIIVRGDIRYDQSDKVLFEKENTFSNNQLTVSLNMLFVL